MRAAKEPGRRKRGRAKEGGEVPIGRWMAGIMSKSKRETLFKWPRNLRTGLRLRHFFALDVSEFDKIAYTRTT